SLKGIGDVPRLRHLRLEMADKLRSLDGLEACESLESVLVSTSRDATFGVNDIGALHEVATLTDLELPGADVSDLRPLSGCTGLSHLDLRDNRVVDLSPLAELKLQWLDLSNNQVESIAALAG